MISGPCTTILVLCALQSFCAWVILACHVKGFHSLAEVTRLFHQPLGELLLLLVVVCGFVQYGATKGTNGTNRGQTELPSRYAPSILPVAVDSAGFSMPTNFPSVTNLCFWGIGKDADVVALGIAWPESSVFTNDTIDLFGNWNLTTNNWSHLAEIDVSGALSNAVVELSLDDMPTNMAQAAFFRIAAQEDYDGDGISDAIEEWVIGSNPASGDSDGDGISDGEEISAGTNPKGSDSDFDGLSDVEELCIYETDPLLIDTDGDGLPDGWEVSNGLDPLNSEGQDGANGDPYGEGVSNIENFQLGNNLSMLPCPDNEAIEFVSGDASWVVVTGDLGAGLCKTNETVVTIPRGTKAFVGVFLHSKEYPDWTQQASQYNDRLMWNISANGHASIMGMTYVNDENGAWSLAESNEQSISTWSPVVFENGGIFGAPTDTNLLVNISISAMNVSDGALPSSVIVGVFPLEVVQSNWPAGMGYGNMTDSGDTINKRLFENDIGYVSASGARPNITAKFADLPDWISVTWAAALTRERSERPASDDRSVFPLVLYGDAEFDLYDEINDTIGGSVTTSFNIDGRFPGLAHYKVRGRNPSDAIARSYIDATVPLATRGYAWKIAMHESRQGRRVYNQFNTGGLAGLPNKGAGLGWGIAQIDNHNGTNDLTPFGQVWDWRENIIAMGEKLAYALERTTAFVGYYRAAYGASPNWCEPPPINVLGVSVSAEMWSVATLYNGAGGIPLQSVSGHTFRSPIEFNPTTGRWIFHNNSTNPDYVRRVIAAGNIIAIE